VTESALPTWYILANIGIILSLNLAVLNLLPLPALDGGRLLFVLIEIVRGGRKIAPEKEGLVHLTGLVLLIGLMFVIAFRDIGRIIGFIPLLS
jgi:regulator of sigma E protease